jgi:hypothetical protein
VENSENFVIFNKPTQKYKKILILWEEKLINFKF